MILLKVFFNKNGDFRDNDSIVINTRERILNNWNFIELRDKSLNSYREVIK